MSPRLNIYFTYSSSMIQKAMGIPNSDHVKPKQISIHFHYPLRSRSHAHSTPAENPHHSVIPSYSTKMFPLLPLLLLPFPFIHSLPQSTANPSSSTIFCGKADYTPSELRAASLRACDLVLAGSTAGSSSYPHEYRNLEDFAFDDIPGPYYEFPILDSGKVYSGGKLICFSVEREKYEASRDMYVPNVLVF